MLLFCFFVFANLDCQSNNKNNLDMSKDYNLNVSSGKFTSPALRYSRNNTDININNNSSSSSSCLLYTSDAADE